jgi:hypothetical protein
MLLLVITTIMTERDTDINSLLNDIRSNPDAIMEFSEEELKKLQNKIFEHGVIKLPEESHAAISIINWRDSYLRKLHFTALIAYLFRLIKEVDAESLPNGPALLNASTAAVNTVWASAKQCVEEGTTNEAAFMKEAASSVKKIMEDVVKEQIEVFFRRHFEFDPDRHVESAFKENLNDPERVGKYAEMRAKMATDALPHVEDTTVDAKSLFQILTSTEKQLSAAVTALEQHKKSVSDRETAITETAKCSQFLSTVVKGFADAYGKGVNMLSPDIRAALALVDLHSDTLMGSAENSLSLDDLSGLLSKHRSAVEDDAQKLYYLAPQLLDDIKGAYDWIPSTNVFYHLDRYLSNHYEQIREATAILYNEKPDIEFQLQYYGSFDSVEAARDFERKYESNVITSVYTIQNGGWTILGPFKENRSRIDFYNKNTEVIKRMFEQAESDQALGKDLMQKRIRRAKKENILSAGPDDPGLAKYKAAVNTIEALGAKEGLTREEKDELAKAHREKEMAEVPEDAIQVDVFGPDSTGKIQKSHFYSQAEAPEFMEQNIADQHDRMRAISQGGLLAKQKPDDDSGSLRVKPKTVTSRDGKVKTIAELKNSLPPMNMFAE